MNHNASKLINSLLAREWNPDKNGAFLNDLLEEFQKGYPIEELLKLFKSEEGSTVRAGSWIASELGLKVCEIFHEIKGFSHHIDPKVRFNLIDCFLLCGSDSESIMEILPLLEDDSHFVRWRMIDFLCRLSEDQIANTLKSEEKHRFNEVYVNGLALLATQAISRKKAILEAEKILLGQPSQLKKFAISYLFRNEVSINRIQMLAIKSGDKDIIDFCAS